MPRSNCPEHGVLNVAVPWAREGSGFTLLFEALAMLLCREMPMAAVAGVGEHDTRLWRMAAHYVEAAHAKSSWAKVRWVSVDETDDRWFDSSRVRHCNMLMYSMLLLVYCRTISVQICRKMRWIASF